jgi:predicted RNase H-like HicB family nuclease
MIYAAYIHKDKHSAWGATLPDFPGCFAAADALDDLPAAVQEAVEVYLEGNAVHVPEPTMLDELPHGKAYTGGQWLLVDIDLARVNRFTDQNPPVSEVIHER